MGQALYRLYRPKNLDQVTGQEHITTTLKNAIKSGKISHAYLFTGPRGVGKTSIARILAHEINQFEYNEAAPQLDIIEIDAASNRRIDEIRDLRDKVHIAPVNGKYKVYIIDEVHMLTKEAFNALLKTLEEPPSHVVFILATTESHKLPETIISRTQRYSFKPIDNNHISKHLKQISDQEKIQISDDALNLIAEHSDGSLRDGVSLLDQSSALGQAVDLESVKKLLGIAPREALDQLVVAMVNGQPKELATSLSNLQDQGYQSAAIAKQLSEILRQHLIDGSASLSSDSILDLLKRLLDVPASSNPEKLLEVILLDVAFSNMENKLPASKPIQKETTDTITSVSEAPKVKSVEAVIMGSSDESNEIFSIEKWPIVLDNIKTNHNTLYGILRMSQPTYENDILTLSFKFAFHQKRIGEPKMQQLINDTFTNMGLKPVKIIAVVSSKTAVKPIAAKPPVDVAAISNIFGDAEVLES